jgi:hypothetical protein
MMKHQQGEDEAQVLAAHTHPDCDVNACCPVLHYDSGSIDVVRSNNPLEQNERFSARVRYRKRGENGHI